MIHKISKIFLLFLLTLVGAGTAWAQDTTWDGTDWSTAAPKFAENKFADEGLADADHDGKSWEKAFVITTARQLAYFAWIVKNKKTGYSSAYYWKLGADIDLGNHNWVFGGNATNAFQGHFDGQNHTISNLKLDVTTNSNYGLLTTIQGASATNVAEVKDLKIDGVTFTSAESRAANTRLGGLAGYAKQANINNVSVNNVTFTYTNTITGANQLGGAIGCMENNTTLDNVDVTGVTATFSNVTTGLYVGGIVGASTGTANTNSMTNCDAKTIKITHSNSITGATYMGGLVGNANTSLKTINNNTVKGVGDGKAFDVSVTSATSSAKNLYAGGLLGYCKGTGQEIKGNSVSNVSITTVSSVNDARLAGFIGSVDGTGGIVSVKENTVTTISVTSNGTTAGTNYLGGFVGYTKGKSSPNERVLIQGNTVTSPTVTMSGIVGNGFYEGGFLGYADEHVNVYNNKVSTPAITVANTINAETYVGGAVGRQTKNTFIDGMTVSGGSISGPSSADATVKNNVAFFVGGFIGQQNSSGTAAYQPNLFKNIAVTGININLGRFVPGGIINNHKFAVGGIAGSVNAPNKDANGFCGMPENIIFKGGKIYAPYAATSPTVPNFNSGTAAHNNLTTEAVTTIDALDKAKTKTWYYSDYELGLSPGLLKASDNVVVGKNAAPAAGKFRLNCDATFNGTMQYITVKNTTFERQNRYQDSERDSKTVLWWTNQNNWATGGPTATMFTNEEQPIYPQNNFSTVGSAELVNFPYYMYFYQGVANANYVASDVADKIIAGIAGNMAEAVKTTPVTLSISNNKEGERGFAQRTITVAAKTVDSEGAETDVTSNYTYQWCVDGQISSSTSSSLALTPHWKDGQGITVNALSGTTIIATATYTLAPGVLHTKASVEDTSSEKVRSDINQRGTKDNPYIIDCESALRQWSYLSTANTNTVWEGIVKPVAPFPTNQIVGHYNRAYYELGNDVTMSDTPFVPISHMGYGADATWGTYNQNFVFQGVFDGKGKAIKNLHITWGAGQYNGNDAQVYYGLFGAVGNPTATAKWGDNTTTSNTVIKNLVIDGAVLTHDVNNTTFSYKKNYTHITAANANNCNVGVLVGVVGSNATIQNIEIRGSRITDDGSADYSLSTRGLYVGGAIGSVMRDFKTTSTNPVEINIRHIAAQVDIKLEHPLFVDNTAKAQLNQFNIGGIIGRFISTNATQEQAQTLMPAYTLYSGTIDAPKAWVSPVLGALRYSSQKGDEFTNYSKQWEGNNNSANTQITIKNALFYNFFIGTTKITDTEPANNCASGNRTLAAHSDASEAQITYNAQKYQGVNFGARHIAEKGISLELINKERTDDYNFVWDGEPGIFVHLSTDPYVELTLSRETDTNLFTATMVGAEAGIYNWKVSFDGTNWHEVSGVTGNTYNVPVSLKKKFVKTTTVIDGKTYSSIVEFVDADNDLCAPKITSDKNAGSTTFTFNLNQKTTEPVAQFATTYQWYSTKNSQIAGETQQTLTLDAATLASYRDIVWCKAVVTEYGEEVETFFIIYGATVIYVNGDGYTGNEALPGNDANDGKTPQTPVLTLEKANSLLKSEADGGTVDNNIVVVMGTLNPQSGSPETITKSNYDNPFQSKGKNPATLTGYYEKDYQGVIILCQYWSDENVVNPFKTGNGHNCFVLADTKFENLTFRGAPGEANSFIECHGNDVTFGKGLVMKDFKNLSKGHGNFGESEKVPELTIVLTATNLSKEDIDKYTNRTKPQVVTFQSGHYGRIMGGRYTNGFFKSNDNTSHTILGSAEHPVWAKVNVDIDKENQMTDGGDVNYSRDINCIIAGLTDGSMYADYEINLHGGNVSYIVGGNQGNPVPNGDKTFTPKDGTSGTFGQWPNATYFGRTVINIEQDSKCKDINVGNLYAGGLGREANGSNATSIVDMYFYGHTEVNVKSGSVGNVYGGGVGGVIGVNPWDAHVPYATTADYDKDKAIINHVQYGDNRFGTWSTMVRGTDAIATVVLHNLKDTGDGYDIENLDLSNSSTTVNVSGGSVNGSIYGGGYGYVPDMPFEVTMQGVGSVFGTSNINISGGTITGNVYGGSQGHSQFYNKVNKYGQSISHVAEMNGKVNLNISGTESKYPTIRGNIYGAGKGIASTATEEYLRIATAGNTDLGNEYKTDITITFDLPKSHPYNGNIYGGGEMGAVDGSTTIIIKDGVINGDVFGGCKGEPLHPEKAKLNGKTNIIVGE